MTQIRNERTRQSMSQKRLAFLAGIDARTLRKIEKGESVSPESYRLVCSALGIEPVAPERSVDVGCDAEVSATAHSPLKSFVCASLSLLFTSFIVGIAVYYFDAQRHLNLGTNLQITIMFVTLFLTFLVPPFYGIASMWAAPDTVISLAVAHGHTVTSVKGALKETVPAGRFEVVSVAATGIGQDLVAMGYANKDDYSRLAKILTAKGFDVQVRQA